MLSRRQLRIMCHIRIVLNASLIYPLALVRRENISRYTMIMFDNKLPRRNLKHNMFQLASRSQTFLPSCSPLQAFRKLCPSLVYARVHREGQKDILLDSVSHIVDWLGLELVSCWYVKINLLFCCLLFHRVEYETLPS